MSRFEHRLRQEMHELAQSLAPDDLRPLRQPPPALARRPGCFEPSGPPARQAPEPMRWLGPLAAMAAIALLAGGLLAARNALHARASQDPPAVAPVDPGVIAVTGMRGAGEDSVIKIMSARDGRVARTIRLATDGNGLAIAADARSLFVVGADLRINQVSVATGESRPVAAGAYPAPSPDSRTLAYASGQNFTDVAIRDLGTGHTRSISLLPLMGGDSSLLNQGGLTWLGNGTQVVAVPEPDPVPVTGGTPGKPVKAAGSDTSIKPVASGRFVTAPRPSPRSSPRYSPRSSPGSSQRTACGQQTAPGGLCVIVVDIGARGLRARQVFVPHVTRAGPLDVLSGDLTAKRSFVVAQPGRDSDVVERITLAGDRVTVRRLVTLPSGAYAVAVAPDADRLLYLPRSSPAALWVATMLRGHLIDARELLTDTRGFELDQAGW